MKERFLERQAEQRERSNKGFTLMEMLIVVAIIAVLIAIAIPVFTTQLERSRESTDVANLRAAYAAGQTAAMTGYYGEEELGDTGNLQYKPSENGALAADGDPIGQGTTANGKFDLAPISGWSSYANGDDVQGQAIVVTFVNKLVDNVNFEGKATTTEP